MTKYSFILLKGDQEGLLEKLQEIGLVDITRSVKPIDDKSAAILADAQRKHALLQSLDKVEIPEGLAHTAVSGDPEEAAKAALDHLAELEEALKAAEKEAAASEPWGEYDRDKLRAVEDAGIPVHFHITPAKAFKAEWADQYALSVVNELDGKVYYVVAGEDPLPDALKRGPKASVTDIQARIATLQANIDREKAVLAGVKDVRGKIENAARRNLSDLDLYLASQAAVPAAENTLVTLVGYAPAEDEEAVTKALDATGEYYFKDAAVVEDNPPISFRNNKFVRMFEVLTDMYGRPAYNGFDPTPFIAVFFLLFFAFCMGDAGYGLILIVIGLLLKKVDSFKDYAPLVVTLGIGTTVIGFLFHTFFSMDIAQWSIFKGFPFLPSKIAGYDGTMVLALIVGIVHLCLAMVVKTYNQTKVKGFANSLGTWGWTLLIVGGTAVGALALIGVLDKDITKWVIIALGIVSAAGIFLLNDLHRNPLINIGSGLWETYNTVTGLLGDVLSYLRLYALGLAGSMLGKAFNDIGGMILGDGSNLVMWIPFILIVLVGHTLNIAMAALGAFVHPLRLNFLEFFKNSGYEAAGRNYNPLKKQ
ncbi:MAG: ATPase V [Bacteroidales bacterium]|nr:ATPase V [Bacteroidales bacterium]